MLLMKACNYFLQVVCLFHALSRTGTNLQKLDLTKVKLSHLEPGLLAEGLATLIEVDSFSFSRCSNTGNQIIFTKGCASKL